jgi:hypothetical protein
MADEPQDPPSQPKTSPQGQPRAFAEAKPLEIVVVPEPKTIDVVVVETPEAQPQVGMRQRTRTRVRQWLPTTVDRRPRVSSNSWWLFVIAAIVLVFFWHWVLSPLVVHAEHSVQRRIVGEQTYNAPTSNPHTHRQKKPLLGFRIW